MHALRLSPSLTLALLVLPAYLASECRRLGLVPLTPAGYAQDLPLTLATIVPEATTVRITGPGVDTTFAYWDDFIPDLGTAATLRGFNGELAYVGRAREILFRRSDLPRSKARWRCSEANSGATVRRPTPSWRAAR